MALVFFVVLKLVVKLSLLKEDFTNQRSRIWPCVFKVKTSQKHNHADGMTICLQSLSKVLIRIKVQFVVAFDFH